MELDQRKRRVLAAVVESYINTGEPVGSKALAEVFGMSVSSATLRNEMAALVEMGYLEQPHTSAGRIPSHQGFRFYIDKLMDKKPLSPEDKASIDELFKNAEPNPGTILEDVGAALAQRTGCAAISTTPTSQGGVSSRIEIVPAGRRIYMLIFITSAGVIKSKLCRLEFEITPDSIWQFTGLVNEWLMRTPIENITPAFIQTLAAKTGEYALTLSPILYTVYELARAACEGQVILEGQNNLLMHRELLSAAGDLLKLLSRGDELLNLIPQQGGNLNVVLGKELNRGELNDIGMIFTGYSIGGNAWGKVGIIGPTRLDYASMIPMLEYFASSMGKLLTDTLGDSENNNQM